MEYGRKSNGLLTLLENFGIVFVVATIAVFCEVAFFFINLTGAPWICFFAASTVLLILGASLIVYAKLPAYRRGRFLTFGVRSVPPDLAAHYRWGWRVFLFAVALSLCLLLSKQ